MQALVPQCYCCCCCHRIVWSSQLCRRAQRTSHPNDYCSTMSRVHTHTAEWQHRDNRRSIAPRSSRVRRQATVLALASRWQALVWAVWCCTYRSRVVRRRSHTPHPTTLSNRTDCVRTHTVARQSCCSQHACLADSTSLRHRRPVSAEASVWRLVVPVSAQGTDSSQSRATTDSGSAPEYCPATP